MGQVIFKSKETVEKETIEAVNRSTSARVEAAKLVVFDENCDMTDFNAACEHFKSACSSMGQILGIEDFKGGYDEINDLKSTAIGLIDTLETKDALKFILVLIDLVSADLNCNHEADKIGLYGASWWYKCWGIEK